MVSLQPSGLVCACATRTRLILAAFLFVLMAACSTPRIRLENASGVVRHGDSLLIVDDQFPGAFFRFRFAQPLDKLSTIAPERLVKVVLPGCGLAIDLESIDVLADGRVALLSERLRSLVGVDGLLAEYEAPFTELGKRGLEGLAVLPQADGSSRVAVLWEGGYVEPRQLPSEVEERIGCVAFPPKVLIHVIPPGGKNLRVLPDQAIAFFSLDVPLPEGAEPAAQRFRAPDLVWQQDGSGFIVLLSSENALSEREYRHHWLLRFDLQGRAVGKPVDLNQLMPRDLQNVNWEGLGWFEPPNRLVAVCETYSQEAPLVLVIDLPAAWRGSASGG